MKSKNQICKRSNKIKLTRKLSMIKYKNEEIVSKSNEKSINVSKKQQ